MYIVHRSNPNIKTRFWATNILSCAAEWKSHSDPPKEDRYYNYTIQHCTNQSKDTVTQRETVNQHPTNKRTLHSKIEIAKRVAQIGKTVSRLL
jgi:hypothetical protein